MAFVRCRSVGCVLKACWFGGGGGGVGEERTMTFFLGMGAFRLVTGTLPLGVESWPCGDGALFGDAGAGAGDIEDPLEADPRTLALG